MTKRVPPLNYNPPIFIICSLSYGQDSQELQLLYLIIHQKRLAAALH